MVKSATNKKTVLKALGTGALFFLFSFGVSAQTIPLTVEGEDTYFEATNDVDTLTFTSTEPLRVRLVSALDTATIRLEPLTIASSTEIVLTGLILAHTYFLYENDYHDKRTFTTDGTGRGVFTQNLNDKNFLIIQPRESTYFIRDDATGGDCASIGIWNSIAKTCVLTGNLAQTIQIDSDGITLDGGGYMLSGPGSGMGVFLSGRKGVTIKNLAIKNFRDNIALISSEGITIEGNTIAEGAFGVSLDTASSTNITKNTFTTLPFGIFLVSSNGNALSQNIITDFHSNGGISLSRSNKNTITLNLIENGPIGMALQYSDNNIIHNNTIRNHGFYAMNLQYSQNNEIFQNNFFASAIRHINSFNSVSLFNRALPDGGNYWDTYDKPAEGCADTNADSFCDTPLVLDRFNSDLLPWITQDGWISAPDVSLMLSYAEEDGFAADAISSGVHPNKGTASSTPMVFKAVYTGATAPSGMNVFVGNGTATTSFSMVPDMASASTTLRDGIFTNGEQYIATSTFPKGKYQYYFEAQSASTTLYLPADGTLFFQTGYSNVAFLPGLEASRLYVQEGLFENQLWTPNTNNDVGKLALSPITGESIDPDIYTNDVVDEAYTVNIYKGFLAHMNAMVANGDIKEFQSLPYDWRMDIKDVATRVISLKNSGYTMVSRIEEMASTSPTGKVTLVTHSNGGLVAKELMNELERQGKAHLVDRIIMIAAPELGTPKAILEMLHGAKFPIGFPSKEATREMAENMKSAYTLLPSQEYFNRLGTSIRPVIEFDAVTFVTEALRAIYSDSISDYDTLRRFLRGEYGGRAEPLSGEVNIPNVLKEHFLVNAEERHKELDAWTPPEGIDVIEVVGWGLDTLRGVRYTAAIKNVCTQDLSVCQNVDVIDPQPLITSEGDGTVVSVSAEALGGERYYVDIFKYNEEEFLLPEISGRSHKNILEIDPLQDLITTLIKRGATSMLPVFISSSTPPVSDTIKRLRISAHSPVSLHLYDESGRHTGSIPNPDPLSDIELFEEQIPNSYYWQIGEGQYTGGGNASTTMVQLNGLSLGTFTLKIEEVIGEEMTNTVLYEDIPVTASTTATVQIGGDITTSLLAIDVNGDGTTDVSIGEGENTSVFSLQILEDIINTMDIQRGLKKDLMESVEKAKKELEKGKPKKATKELDKILSKLKEEIRKNTKEKERDGNDKHEEEDREDGRGHDKDDEDKQKISTEDAQSLIEIVEKIKANVVE